MRISYGLLVQVADSGDWQARQVMTQWESQGNPESPTMTTEAYFQPEVGFFLYTSSGTPLGHVPVTPPKRSATLIGMAAMMSTNVKLSDLDSLYGGGDPSVVITEDDGDID